MTTHPLAALAQISGTALPHVCSRADAAIGAECSGGDEGGLLLLRAESSRIRSGAIWVCRYPSSHQCAGFVLASRGGGDPLPDVRLDASVLAHRLFARRSSLSLDRAGSHAGRWLRRAGVTG
jgi:hypothetical protein